MNLSQQDYVKRIEELNQALITAWEQDQRVKSLKIAIQVKNILMSILLHKNVDIGHEHQIYIDFIFSFPCSFILFVIQ